MEYQKLIFDKLFQNKFGHLPQRIEALPRSGSERQYWRLSDDNNNSLLAVYNPILRENEAYFSFTRHLRQFGIRVPDIVDMDKSHLYYLVEDLGTTSLYDLTIPAQGKISDEIKEYYKQVLFDLVQMQCVAGPTLDYSKCYPVSAFDEQAIQWDLNYFKYNFLKLAGIDFDEYLLENDFVTLKNYLLEIPANWFMFRDFQSRNILINDDKPYYIDFQGARKGPLVYDVASLLYQAKARFSEPLRDELFESYASSLSSKITINKNELYKQFKAFALHRTLQVLGAYGFRGFFEKKPHFIDSIPFAAENLKCLLQGDFTGLQLPYLTKISDKISSSIISTPESDQLTILVNSFSYRKGIPGDPSGNGGGFVFDCRGINNPGRFAEYQFLTGLDKPVIDFFKQNSSIDDFLNKTIQAVEPTIDVYLNRGFKHLMVSFGCTGGQHRSVYCAQHFAEYIHHHYKVNVRLCHREQNQTAIYEHKM